MTAVAIQHRAEIIERMAKGEPITAIAKALGYAGHSGIIERLGDDPEYKAALRSGIIGKLEKREGELEVAPDNVTVTRADRLLGHARWWAEKLDPDRFATKQANITINNNVLAIGDSLVGQASELLDKLRVVNVVEKAEKP